MAGLATGSTRARMTQSGHWASVQSLKRLLLPWATKDYIQSAPRGLAYWEAVNELIQREPVEDRDRFFYAMLRDLGIEKGKPFAPDDRQKKLLEDAALLGEEICKVVVYEKRFIGNYYRPDASWQFALVLDPIAVGQSSMLTSSSAANVSSVVYSA